MRANYVSVVIYSCPRLHSAGADNEVLNHVFRLLSLTTMAHSTNTSAELLNQFILFSSPNSPEALLNWRLNWQHELKINVDNTV